MDQLGELRPPFSRRWLFFSPVLVKMLRGTLREDQETTELLTRWSWGLDC